MAVSILRTLSFMRRKFQTDPAGGHVIKQEIAGGLIVQNC